MITYMPRPTNYTDAGYSIHGVILVFLHWTHKTSWAHSVITCAWACSSLQCLQILYRNYGLASAISFNFGELGPSVLRLSLYADMTPVVLRCHPVTDMWRIGRLSIGALWGSAVTGRNQSFKEVSRNTPRKVEFDYFKLLDRPVSGALKSIKNGFW